MTVSYKPGMIGREQTWRTVYIINNASTSIFPNEPGNE